MTPKEENVFNPIDYLKMTCSFEMPVIYLDDHWVTKEFGFKAFNSKNRANRYVYFEIDKNKKWFVQALPEYLDDTETARLDFSELMDSLKKKDTNAIIPVVDNVPNQLVKTDNCLHGVTLNDVRIGNWLKYNNMDPFQVSLKHFQIGGALDKDLSIIEPIKLNDDILSKMWFNTFNGELFNGIVYEVLNTDFWEYREVKIKYVHQLQNLYYILEGKELRCEKLFNQESNVDFSTSNAMAQNACNIMPSKFLIMKDFNAQQAKQIVDSLYSDELHNILVEIKAMAAHGETVLHIYKHIKGKTVDALRDKGFKVISQPSIAIQKDGLYYSIYWA